MQSKNAADYQVNFDYARDFGRNTNMQILALAKSILDFRLELLNFTINPVILGSFIDVFTQIIMWINLLENCNYVRLTQGNQVVKM